MPKDAAFFDRPAWRVAPELLGCRILLRGVGGRIVETEAYGPDDPASHSFRGLRRTNRTMFGPPARLYVYRSYGIHWCLNIVCARGHAVLLRALEPLEGLQEMRRRRGTERAALLCSGPGRLGQALGVGPEDDGRPIGEEATLDRPDVAVADIAVGPRIGITKAADVRWRFGIAGSVWLSRRI